MSNPDDQPNEVRIRRAPKIPVFLIVGGGLGAIVAFILTALFPVDPAVGFGALFGYFALYGITGGVLVGAIVAIVLDRRSNRRATTGQATIERAEPFVGDAGDVGDGDEGEVAGSDGEADGAEPTPPAPSN